MKATHTYRVWNSREKALIMRDERMMRQGKNGWTTGGLRVNYGQTMFMAKMNRNGIPMAITREVLKAKTKLMGK